MEPMFNILVSKGSVIGSTNSKSANAKNGNGSKWKNTLRGTNMADMTPLEIMARGYCEEGARQGVHIDQACCEERMNAALQALDAAGWVVVPKEATEAMQEVGEDYLTEVGCQPCQTDAQKTYKAMIEAGAYKV